ncbi:MAG: hypothetical protein LRY51_15670 [Geovibrio sp.]|nr:hypothetical protein [Geovibrio sp.]
MKVLPLLPPFVLIFLQPDLGTAGSFLIIWGIVILFIGIKRAPFIFCSRLRGCSAACSVDVFHEGLPAPKGAYIP